MGNELKGQVGQFGSSHLDLAITRILKEIDLEDDTWVTPTQVEHAWNPEDCSNNFSVLSDHVTARRGSQGNSTDVIRGQKGYRSGTHVFEIYWPRSGRGLHAMVGIAIKQTPVHCGGNKHLLGATADSWGWCLVDKTLVHGGKVVGAYPKGKTTYKVPETIFAVLNADDGILRFRDGGEDLGVAFTNLPRQNLFKPLYICAGAVSNNAEVRMKYMGNEGGISQVTKSGKQIVSVPAPLGGSHYSFHTKCGNNVTVQHGGRVARRTDAGDNFTDGVVLTKQPLKNNVRFEVRLDTKVTKWNGSLEIGFTSNSPERLKLPGNMTECRDGVTFMWSGSNVMMNGENIVKLDVDLDNCTVGDTCGVERRRDGTIQFNFNGKVLKTVVKSKSIPDVVYGVVDIYGQAESVTICETGGETAPAGFSLQREKTDLSGSDPNAIMFQMRETIEYLRTDSNTDLRTAIEKVMVTVLQPFRKTNSGYLRQRFGDHLASLGGGHEVKKLLERVQDVDRRAQSERSWLGITILRSVCLNYSANSLKLCGQFGEAGLLELMLKDLDRYGPTNIINERRKTLVRSALAILHNCAKATENKQAFHDARALERISPFLKTADLGLATVAFFTLSFITEEGKNGLLEANEKLIRHILGTVKKALADPKRKFKSDDIEYTSTELTNGLDNFAVNDKNKALIVDMGAVSILVDLMKIDQPTEQECAANAIWTLAKLERNKKKITSEAGCIDTLALLSKSRTPAVRQAAERALVQLRSNTLKTQVVEGGQKVSTKSGNCPYSDLCLRFKKSLELADAFFNPKFDMCYCTSCHEGRGDKLYYTRGKPSKDYGVPIGWCRFALKTPPKAEALQAFSKWHVAFHGTRIDAVKPILDTGELLMPGFFNDDVTKTSYEAKVVFQVCINPDSYKFGPQTIGATSDIDPKFNNQEIEWFTKERGCVIVYGLLVKLE
ncbi:neuralized-like protein 4 [Glandiceps talaboti]